MKQISSLVDMCIAKGYITQEQAPWLYYGIEKRVTTILVSIPMLVVGSLISTPAMAIAFFTSFYLLRTRTVNCKFKLDTQRQKNEFHPSHSFG